MSQRERAGITGVAGVRARARVSGRDGLRQRRVGDRSGPSTVAHGLKLPVPAVGRQPHFDFDVGITRRRKRRRSGRTTATRRRPRGPAPRSGARGASAGDRRSGPSAPRAAAPRRRRRRGNAPAATTFADVNSSCGATSARSGFRRPNRGRPERSERAPRRTRWRQERGRKRRPRHASKQSRHGAKIEIGQWTDAGTKSS